MTLLALQIQSWVASHSREQGISFARLISCVISPVYPPFYEAKKLLGTMRSQKPCHLSSGLNPVFKTSNVCDKRPLSNFTYSEKSSEHDASNLVLRDAHAQRTHQFRPHEVIALTSARGHAARPMPPPRPYNVTEFVLPPEYFLRKLQE